MQPRETVGTELRVHVRAAAAIGNHVTVRFPPGTRRSPVIVAK